MKIVYLFVLAGLLMAPAVLAQPLDLVWDNIYDTEVEEVMTTAKVFPAYPTEQS